MQTIDCLLSFWIVGSTARNNGPSQAHTLFVSRAHDAAGSQSFRRVTIIDISPRRLLKEDQQLTYLARTEQL